MRLPTIVRVGLLAAFLVLASNLALVGFIRWRTYYDAVGDLRERVIEEGSALDDVYSSGGRKALGRALSDTLASRDPQLLAAIVDSNGSPHAGNIARFVALPRPIVPGYRDGDIRRVGSDRDEEAGYLVRPLTASREWLVTGRSFGPRIQFQRTLESSLGLALVLAALLGLLSGLVLARYVARRVAAVTAVADRIGGGDLTHRVPISGGGGDAFDALATQINRMLDRTAALMAELRMLTDSLAHDLRSPVGRLRARIEGALAARDEKKRDQLLSGILQEADSLMRILTTVLEIGRSEALASRKQFAPLDPAGLVAELAEMYEPIAEEAGCTLLLMADPELPNLNGHRQLLAQALSNLLDNALTYARSGGEVSLVARKADGRVRLGVADRGPGIAPADLAEAKRRFGRLDSSRAPGGAGLGLALAEAVAHLHDGGLDLVDNRPGLRAMLDLPLDGTASRLG